MLTDLLTGSTVYKHMAAPSGQPHDTSWDRGVYSDLGTLRLDQFAEASSESAALLLKRYERKCGSARNVAKRGKAGVRVRRSTR